jgi:transcriptional regulator with XRE-family HTH domain
MTDQPIPPDDPQAINPADVYSLPNTLRQWRGGVAWSQEDLERISGVSQRTISAIERGKVSPHDETLEKFAAAFAQELDLDPTSVLRDLKSARDRKPATVVSEFALKLDNLLSAQPPAWRVYYEQLLMSFYYSMLQAKKFADEAARKNRGRKK